MVDTEKSKTPSLQPAVRAQITDIVGQTPTFYQPNEPILGETDNDVIASNLDSLLSDPETIIAYQNDGEEVTGFSLAVPIGRMDRTRQDESQDTAYIYYTAVKPSLRGHDL